MLISEVIIRTKGLLKNALDDTLTQSYLRTWSNCRQLGYFPQEPDYIADLSLNWIADVAKVLEFILREKFRVGITGVYCHQKPLADFGSRPRPEVGDLLLLLEYRSSQSTSIFNALLFQAKTSNRANFLLGNSDLHQLKLYEEWPKFKYMRAGHLNNRTRDIHPKRPCTGAKYLLVDPSYINLQRHPMHFPFGCAIANRSIVLTKNFSDEFIDFLTLDAGKVISDKNMLTEDWSAMIWDLLDITKGKCAKRGHSGLGKGFYRQNANTLDACSFSAGQNPPDYLRSIGSGGRGRDEMPDEPPRDDDGGVSVLYFQISVTGSDENT